MSNLKIGDSVYIQSYKHDGSLHRSWCKGLLIDKPKDTFVVVTDHTWVVESDGRRWLTKEPAICFLYEKRWFNVISMIRRTGIYYYCNMASPSLYDGEAIKNIDYDLDVKVCSDMSYEILDEDEYQMHSRLMHYPQAVKRIIEDEMQKLIEMIKKREYPFDERYINDYLMAYFNGDHKENRNGNNQ